MLYKFGQLEYLVNGVSQVSTLSLIRFIGGKLHFVAVLWSYHVHIVDLCILSPI